MELTIKNVLEKYTEELISIYGEHLKARNILKSGQRYIHFMLMLRKKVWNYMKQPNDIGSNKDLALYRVETAKDYLRTH